jgi:hypothetical protein
MSTATAAVHPRLTRALEFLGASERTHSGRRLLDHLVGTGDLLRQWRCDEAVCRAGLFHSVYGTNAFRQACLAHSERGTLAALIGRKAERLVFLFSIADRPSALLTAVGSKRLACRQGRRPLRISASEIRALLAIETANLIEQGEHQGFIAGLMKLPAEARAALLGPHVAAGVSSQYSA